MTTYLVTYDLRKKKRDYETLHERIAGLGDVTRVLESTWVVNTSLDVHDIVGALVRSDEEGNDGFLVVSLKGPWGRVRLDDESNLQSWLGRPSPIDA